MNGEKEMKNAVSAIPGPDGLVHWDGVERGIPVEVAHGIMSLCNMESVGREQLKSALKRTGFELSKVELRNILEQKFGMKAGDARNRSKTFWDFLMA